MIRRDIVYLAIILILLGIVAVMTCQSPTEPVEDTRKYDSLARVAREGEVKAIELAELRKSDSLETIQTKKSYDSLQKSSVAQIAYYKAHPKVIEIIREVPVIDSAFKAYDSAIVIRDERIAQLSGELYNSQKLAAIAEENFQTTIANYDRVHDNLLIQVEFWQNEAKRQKRQKKGTVILGILIGVAGIAL